MLPFVGPRSKLATSDLYQRLKEMKRHKGVTSLNLQRSCDLHDVLKIFLQHVGDVAPVYVDHEVAVDVGAGLELFG